MLKLNEAWRGKHDINGMYIYDFCTRTVKEISDNLINCLKKFL